MIKDKALLLYILLAFAFCWFWAGIIYVSDLEYGTGYSSIIVALGCMSAPALSAWLVTRYFLKERIQNLNVNWKTARKNVLFMTPVWLPVWMMFFYLCLIAGNFLCGPELFGSVDFSYQGLLYRIEDLTQGQIDPESLNLPSVPVVLAVIIAGGILAGASVNLLFALGEEIGWRGLMFNRLSHLSVNKRVIITGFVWGIWHAPLILMGHNYPAHPITGVFMMVLFCVVLSYLMDWLRSNSNSVLAPAAFHGMINASAAGMMLFVNSGHELIGSVVGLAGILAIIPVYLGQLLISRPPGR
jgi:membrane protease YdiL (CAAX protease family)